MTYLDNNATTQPSQAVLAAMRVYFEECYFNASAVTSALTGVDKPRRDAAAAMTRLLKAEEPECFAFTSGATESNNWVFSSILRCGRRGTVLISAVEHDSVAEPAAELTRHGLEVIELPVDSRGLVRLDALWDALSSDTVLVSIIAANNETGVIEPIAEVGRLIRERSSSALFHTDATQAVGKVTIDLENDWSEVDLLSFSAHKFHGPKGIGGLYVRPGIELQPLLLGGKQEHGRRAGTENTPGLAGLAVAAGEAHRRDYSRVVALRDRLEAHLLSRFPQAVIYSSTVPRLPTTSCFSVAPVAASELASELMRAGFIVGTGSACSSGSFRPAKTLLAMDVPHELAGRALRISLSKDSSVIDVDSAVAAIEAAVNTCIQRVHEAALAQQVC